MTASILVSYTTTTQTTPFSAVHIIFTAYIFYKWHRLLLETATTVPNGNDRLREISLGEGFRSSLLQYSGNSGLASATNVVLPSSVPNGFSFSSDVHTDYKITFLLLPYMGTEFLEFVSSHTAESTC